MGLHQGTKQSIVPIVDRFREPVAWSKGSRLFVIWQQNRWAWTPDAEHVEPGGLWHATWDPGEHLLTIKMSYWLGL